MTMSAPPPPPAPGSETDADAGWSQYPRLLWRGIAMGIAEVIPGVSGGTLALITGVLQPMIRAFHSVDARALRLLAGLRLRDLSARVHWRFLVMLFSGQLLGILLCTRIIPLPALLREHPEPVLGLFFGLIAGSILLLARRGGVPGPGGILCYLAGAIVGACVVAGARTDTPEAPWFVFLCGVVAICAWILPGISGSFVLLLLRKYDYIWGAVTLANGRPLLANLLEVALPFALGAVVGLAAFSRALSWVMERFPRPTMMGMNGLLIASLWAIFPFQHATYERTAGGKEKLIATSPYLPGVERLASAPGLLTLGLLGGGLLLVLRIDAAARRQTTEAPRASAGP